MSRTRRHEPDDDYAETTFEPLPPNDEEEEIEEDFDPDDDFYEDFLPDDIDNS